MKLILKNASLEFQKFVYDADALAILANYTKVLTDGQKYAFNSFILSLKDAGVFDDLTAAYFPCLAGSVAEAMFDAITETSTTITTPTYYVLDGNGIGFAPVSSPYNGVRVNTNLATSIQSVFASIYEPSTGADATSSGIQFRYGIGGGYPKISDYKRNVLPNAYTGNNGAVIPDQKYINETRHYALSWRYTENEAYWNTSHADFCLDGVSLALSPASTDGTALENTWGAKLTLGAGPTLNSSAASGVSRCALVLVMAASTTTERDAINTAVKDFNAAFFGE